MSNKADVLNKTNNGLDFFKFVIKDLQVQGTKCNNINNPFYNDTQESFSIYSENGNWYFKDLNNDKYSGDVFTFASFHYKLDIKQHFNQILEKINTDLNNSSIMIQETINKNQSDTTIPTIPTNPTSSEVENENKELKNDRIFNTPKLPHEVYNNLPAFLKECTELFKDDIEKDVFLIGALGVLSACLPNIEGIYFDKEYSAHLYTFITAPSGAGKGVLNWSKYLGQFIHDNLFELSNKQMVNYVIEIENYNNLPSTVKSETTKPIKPRIKLFFIPANSSSAAFTDTLEDNGFKGILFETEADTLAQTFKNEWGSYSDILRKSFHHEDITQNRKGKYIYIKNPHLSVVLSGTPQQVRNLMPDEENGLFSRFLYYAFEDDCGFKNPFKSDKNVNFKEYFTKKGKEISDFYNFLSNRKEKIIFEVTEEQSNNFTKTFDKMIFQNRLLIGRSFDANIKRLGLITFRIAMILSALKNIDNKNITNKLICDDIDYNTALEIAFVLVKHSIAVFQNMPKHNLKANISKFYETLPDKFDRQKYLEIALNLKINDKTAQKYINHLKSRELLKHNDHNQYSKI